MHAIKRKLERWLHRLGIRIITRNSPNFSLIPENADKTFVDVYHACSPFTLTSFEAQFALYNAVRHVCRHDIPGEFVECGVYKGGSSMVAAMALRHAGDLARRLWLYDTFEGMPAPTKEDLDFKGRTPEQHLQSWGGKQMGDMTYCAIEAVKRNLQAAGLPDDRYQFVKGKVEETLPGQMPGKIAVLRLDTDWYQSTQREMEHLFPRLSPGGVLIVDDYGFWRGSRQACDEYFEKNRVPILLTPVDRNGVVIGVKTN